MNRKTVWLLAVLLLASVKFAEAQEATKMPLSVKLHWEDTSDTEKGFRIYRITPKGKTKIAEVSANVTTYTDKSTVSRTCFVVTAFNSAGESDPSNISCVDDSSATRGQALGGGGFRSGAPRLGNRRKLCEVQLSPRGLELLSEVEKAFNKQILDRWHKNMNLSAAALIASDGTPTIRCNPAHRDLNEEIIVHELSHLRLRAAGFPTTEFSGIEADISRWIHENLYETIQHWIMYPHLRKLGYSPDAAKKRDVERVISENKFSDEPLPPSDIISRYVRVALEANDPLLIDQFGQWYLRRGWATHLKKARNLVQFIKNTNPVTAEQAVQSLVELANVLFEPYLTFKVEHWEAEPLGSIVDRKVLIRALPPSLK